MSRENRIVLGTLVWVACIISNGVHDIAGYQLPLGTGTQQSSSRGFAFLGTSQSGGVNKKLAVIA